MIPVQEKAINADEFWELLQQPENHGRKIELIEGIIYEMAGGTGGEHGEVGGIVFGVVWQHVREHKLGRMTAAETCYVLHRNPDGKDTVLCPDAGFVTMARAPKPLTPGYVPFAPDLAVEVVSPTNEATEVHNKVLNYLRYGTRLVWVVYPDSQTVMVYTPSWSKLMMPDDRLDGGDVLPGFTLAVKDIFPA